MKIVFAPGCFDNFEGTQEELDEFIAEITKQVESGDFEKNAIPLDDDEFEELDEDLQEKLLEAARDKENIVKPRNKRLN